MDRNQVRFAFLKLMFAILAGTSWVFSSFLFASRPEQASNTALTNLVRLPASLPAGLPQAIPMVFSAPAKALVIRMDVVNVECWDKTAQLPVETDARWIRLLGRNCQTDNNADTTFVRNLSNGYSATTFLGLKGELTTDFIPLEEGENQIQVRYDHGGGVSFENQFKVRRE